MTPTPLPELPSSHLCQVLSRSKARLQRRVRLSEGVELAVWANVDDEVRYCQPGHHTLSVYLAGGEGSQLKARPEAMGAPGRICIFTPEDESHWLVRSPVQFLHLYVSDLAWAGRVVRMLDAEPRSRTLRAQIYGDDQAFHAGARALMQLDWQDPQQQLAADAIGQQLVDRLVLQSATPRQLQALQRPLGGLSAAMRRRVLAMSRRICMTPRPCRCRHWRDRPASPNSISHACSARAWAARCTNGCCSSAWPGHGAPWLRATCRRWPSWRWIAAFPAPATWCAASGRIWALRLRSSRSFSAMLEKDGRPRRP